MSLGKSSAIYLLALAAFAATSAKAQQWQPSPEQLASANDVLNRYFSATGKGLAQETYDLMSDRYHALDTFPAFEEDFNRTFSATGTLKDVKATHVAWSKDPTDAPSLGVYVAVDLSMKFEHTHLHCGYLILFQPPTGGKFFVTRSEFNFIDDSNVAKMGPAQTSKIWSELNKNCPNYTGG